MAEIIEPPPDLKTIIDNTAKYVAKNGVVFEERIKTKQLNNPKFKFLFLDDPLHAYYLAKVNEARESLLGTFNEKKADEDDVPAKEQNQQAQEQPSSNDEAPATNQDNQIHVDQQHESRQQVEEDDQNSAPADQVASSTRARMLDEYIEQKTLKLEEPPELNFLSKPASTITLMENDIIKLTAQYIATYGRTFMLDLINKEHSNPIFDFTKPQHGQFTYMTNLIMQYALIINHPLGIVEELTKDITSRKQLIDKFKMRMEWQKMLDREKQEREENLEKEKLLYSQIDWHDFVIVETIDYQPDEKGEFPPTTADQVGTRLLMQQRLEQTRVVPEEMDIDMDMDESDQEVSDG